VVDRVAAILGNYVAVPHDALLAMAAWVVAARLMDLWDRFPNVAITSPDKRCGKTRVLELLAFIVARALFTTNISPAALYRKIEKDKPTLLLDEGQSLARRGSESSEVLRELLNAGISKDAKAIRCSGDNHDATEYSVYCPKVIALIGDLDAVLADRCLPVQMSRKNEDDQVEKYRSRLVEPLGKALSEALDQWAEANREQVAAVYDQLEPFGIANDRMAELLMPLQAVLTVAGKEHLPTLERYAQALDERDREQETQSPGVRLLLACREIFQGGQPRFSYLPTANLVQRLVEREDDPWATWNRGQPITREKLAWLLRPFGVKSERSKDQKTRGYYAAAFAEAWARYLPPLGNSANPAIPASPAGYAEYLRTPRWVGFSQRVREHWGQRCAVCNAGGPLEVHHRTYERLGKEEMTDVLPLCAGCHRFADEARRRAKA